MSNVIGNLAAYFITAHVTQSALFGIFTTVAVIGTIVIGLQKKLPSTKIVGGYLDVSVKETPSLSRQLKQSASALKDPVTYLLFPMFFWTGFELAFWTGEFTLLLDSKVIGLVLVFEGIAEVISAVTLGWLSDHLGDLFMFYKDKETIFRFFDLHIF